MKRFILVNSLILIAACPVTAIPTIAYEGTSVVNNVLDDLWWEGNTFFKVGWEYQPANSRIHDKASMDEEITGTSLAASIDGLRVGNSKNRRLRNRSDLWLNMRAKSSHGNPKSSGFKLAPGLRNNAALNARSHWVTNNGSNHANTGAHGVVSYSPPVAPAPGAILLGSIGVGAVGWLHRRQKL